MVLMTSLVTMTIVYYWQQSALPYAFVIALIAEIFYLLYIYNLIKNQEMKLKEHYNAIAEKDKITEKELEKKLSKREEKIKELEAKIKEIENKKKEEKNKIVKRSLKEIS